jgi:HEPN domain-containing protein
MSILQQVERLLNNKTKYITKVYKQIAELQDKCKHNYIQIKYSDNWDGYNYSYTAYTTYKCDKCLHIKTDEKEVRM